jgi:hypothetical protein
MMSDFSVANLSSAFAGFEELAAGSRPLPNDKYEIPSIANAITTKAINKIPFLNGFIFPPF